jgi:tripartite-type tricarboxylate transporter receptor subunit TctC
MKLPRRQFLHLAASAAALPILPQIVNAQAYPTRPVHLVVGVAAGGGADFLARLIGQWLSDHLGQPFIIENRLGAGGNLAAEGIARSPADGYALLLLGPVHAISFSLYDKLNYNVLRDITAVAGLVRIPIVLETNPLFPPKTVPELIAYAKANPGKTSMASAGVGTSNHLSGELFKMMAGVDMVHVPYRGAAPALTDLIGGQVQVLFDIPASFDYVKSGKVRPLAVTTASRSEALPDVPSIGEFIAGYEASAWFGIGAPRNTPAEVVNMLNTQINAALSDPKFRSRLAEFGGTAFSTSPAEFAKFISDETEKWGKVIRAANIKPG